jgi:hypothetical protein
MGILAFAIRHWRILALLACVLGLFWFGYHTKAKIDAREAEMASLRAANASLALQVKQAAATERVVTKYVDRVKVVEGRTRTIIKEVPVYVPADSPLLPPGYRVLHDAAAEGVIPDPARIADAAPVPAQDAASGVIDNYGTCHANAEQLTALQEWIREQEKLAK